MRDSFDHYFAGWTLDSDDPRNKEFGVLVSALGVFVTSDPKTAEEWRVFPLDGKKDCFFHFLKKARDAGVLPAETKSIMESLATQYPRLLG